MTAGTDLHPLARGYLDRLRAAAQSLTADEADGLVADIADHLREALPATPSEAEVRTVLDRLGTPQELVAAAGGPANISASAPATGPGAAPPQDPRFGAVEVLALVGLVGAELLFILWPLAALLWLAGLVLIAVSRVWSGRQKAWGLAGLATGFPVAFTVLAIPAPSGTTVCEGVASPDGSTVSSCVTEGGWPDWAFTVVQVLLVAYLCVQVWTLWRLTRRR